MRSTSTSMADQDNVSDVVAYYEAKLAAYGPTARGVDWRDEASQTKRFEQLARALGLGESTPRSGILDFGCGYGALVDFLGNAPARYTGFDVSRAMIEAAQSRYSAPNRFFTTEAREVPSADYSVASGIFSVKMDVAQELWEAYVIDTLDLMASKSTQGFAFNMLTAHSDADRMRADLYYADPHKYFDLCRTRFGRNVAVLHDYDLYEFTLLVRLKTGTP